MTAPVGSRTLHAPTSVVLGLLVLLTGCGAGSAPPATTGVAYCESVGDRTDGTSTVEVELRQGDEVVGEGTTQVGAAVGFQVPLGRRTDIYVDGQLRGSAGETDDPDDGVEPAPGGWVYISGDGCPQEPPGG